LNTPSSSSAIVKAGEDPLFVFLHGIQGSKELFLPLFEQASLKTKAICAIDFPGFGENHLQDNFEYSIQSYARFVQKILTETPMRPVIFIGHSLGGMVATSLIQSNCNIKAVISLEGNLTLADCGATREISADSFSEFKDSYLPKLLDNLAHSKEPSAHFRRNALQKADQKALYRIACSIVQVSSTNHLLETLSATTIPTMLLVGANSSFSTRQVSGHTKVVTIPNASHFMLHDNLPGVSAAIEMFLSEL